MDHNNPATVSGPEGNDGTQGSSPLPREGERLLGQLLCGRYRVLSILDYGGMGVIYRAEQVALNRMVALKVLRPSVGAKGDPEFRERFLLEASTAARLKHPNTVTIYDFGEFEPGAYFIAMELLEGESLGRRLESVGALDPIQALSILQKVCGSLGEAHSNGVVHRDVKPANIFLTPREDGGDDVTMLDFGLVKTSRNDASHMTQLGIMVGSPRFMSPEQIRSGEVDARSDIYSLGTVLYRCVTGHFLFDSGEHLSIVFAHVHEAPRPYSEICPELNLPMSLEVLNLRCLAKDPANRYQTMEALGEAMGEVIEALKGAGPTPLGSPAHGDPMVESLTGTTIPMVGGQTPLVSALESWGGEDALAQAHGVQPQEAPAQTSPRRVGIYPLLALLLVMVALGAWAIIEGRLGFPGQQDTQVQVGPEPRSSLPPESGDSGFTGTERALQPAPPRGIVSLTVSTVPDGVTLYKGDADLGEAPVVLPVPEGESWALSLRKEGYEDRLVTVMGGQESVTFRLKRLEPPPAPPRDVEVTPKVSKTVDLPPPDGSGTDLRDPWQD